VVYLGFDVEEQNVGAHNHPLLPTNSTVTASRDDTLRFGWLHLSTTGVRILRRRGPPQIVMKFVNVYFYNANIRRIMISYCINLHIPESKTKQERIYQKY
jgi:hypothetical protein